MNIGFVIKDIRKKKQITQATLSNLCGVSQSYLSSIENGNKRPEFKTLEIICDSLKVSISDLFLLSLQKEDIRENQLQKVNSLKKEILNEIIEL